MTDTAIIVVNLSGSLFALGVNWWASKVALLAPKSLFRLTAGFAATYVAAYGLLLAGFNPELWTRIMRGWSIGVWPMVWSGFAVWAIQAHRQYVRTQKEIQDAMTSTQGE